MSIGLETTEIWSIEVLHSNRAVATSNPPQMHEFLLVRENRTEPKRQDGKQNITLTCSVSVQITAKAVVNGSLGYVAIGEPHILQEKCEQLPTTSKSGKRLVLWHINSVGKIWLGFLVDLAAVWNVALTNMSGCITSPYYPGNSPNDFHCTWQIRVPANYVVMINFLMFDFTHHPKCENGFLQIRDGANPSSPSLGRFCGYKFPKVLESSANEMAIEFKASSLRSKFKISYFARKSEYSSISRLISC